MVTVKVRLTVGADGSVTVEQIGPAQPATRAPRKRGR